MRRARAAALAALLLAAPAQAQDLATGVVVIDREAVLRGTLLGQARLADLAAAEEALAAENREIEARLVEEERDLAARRPEMDVDAFRADADAFDRRVTELRRIQDAKTASLLTRRDALAEEFWQEVVPLLGQIMAERRAGVMLDVSSVFLSDQRADVTALAIERIDAATEEAGPAAPAAASD